MHKITKTLNGSLSQQFTKKRVVLFSANEQLSSHMTKGQQLISLQVVAPEVAPEVTTVYKAQAKLNGQDKSITKINKFDYPQKEGIVVHKIAPNSWGKYFVGNTSFIGHVNLLGN